MSNWQTTYYDERVDSSRCVGCNQFVVDAWYCVECAVSSSTWGWRTLSDERYGAGPTAVGKTQRHMIDRSSEWEQFVACMGALDGSKTRRMLIEASYVRITHGERVNASVSAKLQLHDPFGGLQDPSLLKRRERRRAQREEKKKAIRAQRRSERRIMRMWWTDFVTEWGAIGWAIVDDLTRPEPRQ